MKTLCSKIKTSFTGLIEGNRNYRTTTLADGSTITRPLALWWIGVIVFVAVFVYFSIFIFVPFFKMVSLYQLWMRFPNFFSILVEMATHFDIDYFDNILNPLLDTVKMAVVGTAIGAAMALPVAFLASKNIVKSKALTAAIKFVLSLIRTVPTLMFAMIMTFIFNFGTFSGTLAIIVFTFTIAAKLLYETIETVDLGAFTAIEMSGASVVRSFWTGILPQILGAFYSTTLYTFELNIRASAILGFVGAGGIGVLMNTSMLTRQYGEVTLMLVALLLVVLLVEYTSRMLRKRFN